jgi:hypothetical protein
MGWFRLDSKNNYELLVMSYECNAVLYALVNANNLNCTIRVICLIRVIKTIRVIRA